MTIKKILGGLHPLPPSPATLAVRLCRHDCAQQNDVNARHGGNWQCERFARSQQKDLNGKHDKTPTI